jgi:hypothetical protein
VAQFLRPDGNVTQTSFTNGFANIDEAVASDADFAYGANNVAAVLEVSLSNPAGTPGSGTCTVRYRIAKTNAGALNGSGSTVTVTGAIYQGAALIAADVARTATGSWVAYSFTFAASLVSDWTNLRFRATTSASGGTSANRRGGAVSWAELEAPDAAVVRSAAGSAGFAFAGLGVAAVAAVLAGSTAFALGASGTAELAAQGRSATGTAPLEISASGSVVVPIAGTGGATLTLGADGVATVALTATGDAPLALSAAGIADAPVTGLGAVALTLGADGTASVPVAGTGAVALALGAEGAAGVSVQAAGAAAFALDASGTALLVAANTRSAEGAAGFEVTADGTASNAVRSLGAASLALAASGVAVRAPTEPLPVRLALGAVDFTLTASGTARLPSGVGLDPTSILLAPGISTALCPCTIATSVIATPIASEVL